MSDGSTGAIGPVSVRYAAQIRELLYAQAVHRMVADQEAARAEADRTARIEAAAQTQAREPLDVKVQTLEPYNGSPAKQADASSDKPAVTAGQLVDIQA